MTTRSIKTDNGAHNRVNKHILFAEQVQNKTEIHNKNFT